MIYTPLISRYDGSLQSDDTTWTGVAYIHDGHVAGSAVLLASGLQLLTVAHVVDALDPAESEVIFDTAEGAVTRHVQSMVSYPGSLLSSDGIWNDLALVTLDQAAPVTAERYDLYTDRDEVGQNVELVGYGQAQNIYGQQLSGVPTSRRAGENIVDALGSGLASFGWQGSLADQLIFDYDDGTSAHDALGTLLGDVQRGVGGAEAMITPGDSGGGLFINQDGKWLLAGVNSSVTRLAETDISSGADGSVGDIGLASRVSSYRDWIETSTGQAQTPLPQSDTPPPTADVPLEVAEGQGTWFQVQLSRSATEQATVDFCTRDGTAIAGQDYIPTSGTLTFAEGQQWAKIWVQTLADDLLEGDEIFYLVLSNPHGASFVAGRTELTAMRTIVDDPTLTGVTQLAPALFG